VVSRTAFVAGATGVIGTALCDLLLRDGWRVVGVTRSPEKVARLRESGLEPVVVDVFDRTALRDAVIAAAPDVVVHQLTDLPKVATPESMAAGRHRNARLREVGTAHLVEAAIAAGARRIVAQSIAFAYAPGAHPFSEDAPLDLTAYPSIASLERAVLESGIPGIVLRYGRLYGPGTWTQAPPSEAPLHVDAAADAARLAMSRGEPGAYNVAEDDAYVSTRKARRVLGWRPEFRR
jgi:nucleoside-diphosphate-sugar epimerase